MAGDFLLYTNGSVLGFRLIIPDLASLNQKSDKAMKIVHNGSPESWRNMRNHENF